MDLMRTMSIPDKLTGEATSSLAERASEGDASAFNEVVKLYYERLYRYLYALVRHPEDAADLTQEVFLKVYRGLPRFNPGKPFEPWLFTIARRTAMSHFRKQRQMEPLEDKHIDPQKSQSNTLSQTQSIWELAQQLPHKLHQVLLLHYREDFPVAEVAGIMGLSKIHTRVLLHRARNQIRELYKTEEVS